MVSHLTKPAFHIALLLILAMAVSSCGRRGDLQAPGSVQADGTEQVEQTTADDVEEVKEDKPFFLDGLL